MSFVACLGSCSVSSSRAFHVTNLKMAEIHLFSCFFRNFPKMSQSIEAFLKSQNKPKAQINERIEQNLCLPDNHLNQLLNDSDSSLDDEAYGKRHIEDRGFYNSENSDDDLLSEPEPEQSDYPKRLLWCATKGELDEFKTLFKHGPLNAHEDHFDEHIEDTLRIVDEDKYTVMHKAGSNGQKAIIQYLINDAGLDSDQIKFLLQARTDSGWTALHCACHWNFVECVYMLARQMDCDVLAKSDGNLTPAHVLSNLKKPRESLVEILMAHCDESYRMNLKWEKKD